MDVGALIAGFAVIIGIIAGIVQVIGYLETRSKNHPDNDKEKWLGFKIRKRETAKIDNVILPESPRHAILDQFESNGNYAGALQWISQRWKSLKSWYLLVQYLHFAVLLGEAGEGLKEYIRFRETLTGQPPQETDHAIRYYVARLRGQQRWVVDALNLHRQNVSLEETRDIYQWKSSFEIAQLSYRIEDFKLSKTEFQRLWKQLEKLPKEGWSASILPRVLNYLGTFEMLHVVYDFPFSQVQSGDWQIGNATKCLEFADKAYQYATQSNNFDVVAWSFVVRAFGLEGLAEFEKANEEYEKSKELLQHGAGQRTSFLYILTYHAGFYRRRMEFDQANKLLHDAMAKLPLTANQWYKALIYDHFALLAEQKGDHHTACEYFSKAMRLYSEDLALQTRVDWPLMQRLRQTCNTTGFDFDQFFSS